MAQAWTEWGTAQVVEQMNLSPGWVRNHRSEAAARRYANSTDYLKVVKRRVVAQDWIVVEGDG